MLGHLEVKATLSTKKTLTVLGFKMNIREFNRYIYFCTCTNFMIISLHHRKIVNLCVQSLLTPE